MALVELATELVVFRALPSEVDKVLAMVLPPLPADVVPKLQALIAERTGSRLDLSRTRSLVEAAVVLASAELDFIGAHGRQFHPQVNSHA